MEFRKSDLKDGDIVTYRNGVKRTVRDNALLGDDGHINCKLNIFTENLENRGINRQIDIVKVERPVKYETVFERKKKY